jgi:hypothetical protein
MRPLFALGRILGNELPPRDDAGGRLMALARLLREPDLGGVVKFWIVNRVWDPDLAAAYREMLIRYGRLGRVHEIPFEPDRYCAAAGRDERLCYCPGINHARNEGLRLAFGRHGARFAAILDGDCGFTRDQWEEVSTEILGDHVDGVGRPAYAVPTIRMTPATWDDLVPWAAPPVGQPEEPMLILARRAWDQGLRYDEARPFGANDKVELLARLGYVAGRTDRCRAVGSCCHINTGPAEVEADVGRRMRARAAALERMHEAILRRHHQESSP